MEIKEDKNQNIETDFEIVKEIDKTVKDVCEKIQKKEALYEDYADIVKALALLVEARARLVN